MLHIKTTYKSYPIHLVGIPCGKDVSVTIYGGEVPHIGAVAMSITGPALHNPTELTCTEQMLSVQGHKEAELAKSIASMLASGLTCTVSVSCGIHYPNLSKNEIKDIVLAVQKLANRFLDEYKLSQTSSPQQLQAMTTYEI